MAESRAIRIILCRFGGLIRFLTSPYCFAESHRLDRLAVTHALLCYIKPPGCAIERGDIFPGSGGGCCSFKPYLDLTAAFCVADCVELCDVAYYFRDGVWLLNAIPNGNGNGNFVEGKVIAYLKIEQTYQTVKGTGNGIMATLRSS